jgi:hypothetical protein
MISIIPRRLRDENLVVAVALLIQPIRAIPYRRLVKFSPAGAGGMAAEGTADGGGAAGGGAAGGEVAGGGAIPAGLSSRMSTYMVCARP